MEVTGVRWRRKREETDKQGRMEQSNVEIKKQRAREAEERDEKGKVRKETRQTDRQTESREERQRHDVTLPNLSYY